MTKSIKNVGIFIFSNMTMLDSYGPQQILGFVQEFNTFSFAKTPDVVVTDTKVKIIPDYSFQDCPQIDILVVPGGGDPSVQMKDPEVIAFIQKVGAKAEYVTSVCSGSLILAEAGLLDGYKAITHWAFKDYLKSYENIEVVEQRVVVDRGRITGGGVTAGIDFALTVVGEVMGKELGSALELLFEYNPQPPFKTGSDKLAPPELVQAIKIQVDGVSRGVKELIQSKENTVT